MVLRNKHGYLMKKNELLLTLGMIWDGEDAVVNFVRVDYNNRLLTEGFETNIVVIY